MSEAHSGGQSVRHSVVEQESQRLKQEATPPSINGLTPPHQVTRAQFGRQMEFRERALYHQIHPVKLLTDGVAAIGAAALLWEHRLVDALLIGFVPSLAVSAFLICRVDLEPYRRSPFGRYVARSMTHLMEAVRLGGLALLWGGAWVHRPLLMALGLAVILLAWLRGKLSPERGPGADTE